MSRLPGALTVHAAQPQTPGGHLFFFSYSLNHCLVFVSPFACLLMWWAAACLPAQGEQQGRRMLFVQRAEACKGSSLCFLVNKRGSCPASWENVFSWLDATQTTVISGHWELQRQHDVRAAKDRVLPGYLWASSTSSKEGVGMIELFPWK